MPKLLQLLLFFLIALSAVGNHITGGEMFYFHTGTSNGQHTYRVTLKLFMRCNSGRTFNNPTIIGVFKKSDNSRVQDIPVPLTRTETIQLNNPDKCITNPPVVCYEVGYYEFNVSLPPSVDGYIITGQVVYRVAGINNLTQGYGNIGATYTAEIPGTSRLESAPINKSANFVGSDLVVICAGNSFNYSFAANDPDGDQLRYSFSEAYQGGGGAGTTTGVPSEPPPYYAVPYGTAYSSGSPLGSLVKVDPQTGLITGRAPATAGIYVVTVAVEEIRNGAVIAVQRKDIQIAIASCTVAAAQLQPEYMLCKETTTINLVNLSLSPLINSQYWELSGASTGVLHSSTNPTVQYQFPDTGLYNIKLVINRNKECTDSTTAVARVYPGLLSSFTSTGACFTKPTRFADLSITNYGQVNSWKWNLGELGTIGNNPTTKNASLTYAAQGSKQVQLIVGTSKGCLDTVAKTIAIVDKPPLSLAFRDTLICANDMITFAATGNGLFSWTPSLNLINSNTAKPTATPDRSMLYYVDLNDDGCLNRDSVKVRVTDHVSLTAMADTTICSGDSIRLRVISDGFTYTWTPSSQVLNATTKNPLVLTAQTTTYKVQASIGGCSAVEDIIVTAVPYPKANAGSDTTICFQSLAFLHGETNGTTVRWSPGAGSSLATSVKPATTTAYILSALDNKGCPKAGSDTMLVTVLPKIHATAGHDTAVIVNQPLQLKAGDGKRYTWSPASNLSAANIFNPIATFSSPSVGRTYQVYVYNEAGCVDSATITVKVFKTAPEIFVPSAFSPDGNGKNDRLRPVPVGMKNFEQFTVFNRWGQQVFSANDLAGWDGSYAGKPQSAGIYVWVAKGVDYTGSVHVSKGTVLLIR